MAKMEHGKRKMGTIEHDSKAIQIEPDIALKNLSGPYHYLADIGL